MIRRRLVCVLGSLALAAASAVGAEDPAGYLVVVHPDNPRATITADRLSRLFLRRVTGWENGEPVHPVDLTERSPVREAFSRDVHGRRTTAIKSFWQKMIFSGTATPPPEVDSDAEVLEYVRSRPGSIGYVSATLPAAQLTGVKVLRVAEEQRSGEGRAGARERASTGTLGD